MIAFLQDVIEDLEQQQEEGAARSLPTRARLRKPRKNKAASSAHPRHATPPSMRQPTRRRHKAKAKTNA